MSNHVNNHRVSGTNQASLHEGPMNASQPRPPTLCGYVCAALWGAVRDSPATMAASMLTLAAVIGVRSLVLNEPLALHGVGVLVTGVCAVAAGRFGWHVGHVAGGGLRRWGGGAVCVATSVTVNVLAIWVMSRNSGTVAVKLFATVLYSGLREGIQSGILKPRLPDTGLRRSGSLRWGGSNTKRHVLRLGIQVVIYAAICASLNGIAQSNVVSPNFNTLDQPRPEFGLQSLASFGFRSACEGIDAVVGIALLIALFRGDIEIRPEMRWCGNAPSWNDLIREGSSRIFMNGIVAGITSMFSSYLGLATLLSAVTTIRGALVNMQLTDQNLVRRHLEQVVAYMGRMYPDQEHGLVEDLNPLIQGLPADLRSELWTHRKEGVVSIQLVESQLNDPATRKALVSFFQDYYKKPGPDLDIFMRSFLKQERERLLDAELVALPEAEEKEENEEKREEEVKSTTSEIETGTGEGGRRGGLTPRGGEGISRTERTTHFIRFTKDPEHTKDD